MHLDVFCLCILVFPDVDNGNAVSSLYVNFLLGDDFTLAV
nr:MAG TPA: hypothetical protein [Bacteriophage sp.]